MDMVANFKDGGHGSYRCLHLGLTSNGNVDIALTKKPV